MTDSVNKQLNRNGNKRGMSPNSRKNLLLGQKANNHALKKFSLTACAREKLNQPCPYALNKTWREYLVERWLGQAVENATFFKELIERIEGKVMQPIEADIREIRDVGELTDEELAIIAAERIIKNNTSRCGNGASEEADS